SVSSPDQRLFGSAVRPSTPPPRDGKTPGQSQQPPTLGRATVTRATLSGWRGRRITEPRSFLLAGPGRPGQPPRVIRVGITGVRRGDRAGRVRGQGPGRRRQRGHAILRAGLPELQPRGEAPGGAAPADGLTSIPERGENRAHGREILLASSRRRG